MQRCCWRSWRSDPVSVQPRGQLGQFFPKKLLARTRVRPYTYPYSYTGFFGQTAVYEYVYRFAVYVYGRSFRSSESQGVKLLRDTLRGATNARWRRESRRSVRERWRLWRVPERA
jgi:hypothetical protein